MENIMAEENKSHRASAPADAQDKFESSKMHARQAAEDLRDATGAIAGEYRGKAEQAWSGARSICFGRALSGRGAFVFRVWVRLSAGDGGCRRRSSRKSLMAVDSPGRRRPAYFARAYFFIGGSDRNQTADLSRDLSRT